MAKKTLAAPIKKTAKRRSNGQRLNTESVLAAIDSLSGNLSAVARQFGVQRSTVYRFIQNHEDLKTVVKDSRETFIDNVEAAIYRNALADNVTAQIFILKTLGKDRGYVERLEVKQVDVSKLSDEELQYIVEAES